MNQLAGFLLGLVFGSEDGGSALVRNITGLLSVCLCSVSPEDRSVHNHRCEDLKSILEEQELYLRTK
jgi:hypothetical protein